MARRLFFVESVRRGAAEISGGDAQHLTRVLRVEPGQRYEISDNRSLWLAEVETARKSLVVFRVLEPLEAAPPPVRLTLCAALIRFERFEWMVEKATELGAETIVPVRAARTEKGLDRAAAKRVERWRKLALETSQQCRRPRLPRIAEPCSFEGALPLAAGLKLRLEEADEARPLAAALPAGRDPSDEVAVLVGPEGGWTDSERKDASGAGWIPVSLGPTILRTETAALAALAVLMSAWQRD